MNPPWEAVLDVLPQTQCSRCGYPDCAAYAQAIARGEAAINRCPPGGAEGITRLAALTGQAAQPLDPACGSEGPRQAAVIDEAWCIGCTRCLPVCPTDAIVGSSKRMHTVLDRHCTGCALCLPVCPVDCIRMETVSASRTGWQAWSAEQAQAARQRYERHQQRRGQQQAEQTLPLKAQSKPSSIEATSPAPTLGADEPTLRRAAIDAALARARAQRERFS